MRVLLINPRFPTSYWGLSYALSILGKRTTLPPLGLLTVAALCPPVWSLRLLDMNVEPLRDRDLRRADLVLTGGMHVQRASLNEVLARCRAAGVRTVVGGPYATSSPEELDGADHLVLDEAEITLPRFLADLAAGVPHRVYQSGGVRADLTRTPPPRFDLLRRRAYLQMSIQFSRGCPFNCEFCDITALFGRRPRTKAPAQILAELQRLYDLGFRGQVFMVDDNFIGNKTAVRRLLVAILGWQERHGHPFSFFTEASINLAQEDELLDLMTRAGFASVFVGIETPTLRGLQLAKKLQNTAVDMHTSLRRVMHAGLAVMGGFIVGFDTDGEDIFDQQLEFITRASIPMAMVGVLTALPRTQLWARLAREGRLLGQSSGDNCGATNFVLAMPVPVLARGYRRLMAELYAPDRYFSRVLGSLAELARSNIGRLVERPSASDWLIALRSIAVQGVAAPYRRAYWAFLSRAWREHRPLFPLAVAWAIAGHHFITYTERDLLPSLVPLLDPPPS